MDGGALIVVPAASNDGDLLMDPAAPTDAAALAADLERIDRDLAHQESTLRGMTPQAVAARLSAMRTAIRGQRQDLVVQLSHLPHNYSTFLHYTDPTLGGSLLHMAAHAGFLKAVQYFVAEGLAPTQQTTNGTTPFYCACSKGHLAVAKFLHRADKATLNMRKTCGKTPLFTAVNHLRIDVVRWLLRSCRGIDVTHAFADGVTVMHLAAWMGNLDVVDILLSNKKTTALLNVWTPLSKNYPLHVACERGHLAVIQRFIGSSSIYHPLSALTVGGKSSLSLAVQGGHIETVRWLLGNTRADATFPQLITACKANNLELVRVLVELSLDTNPIVPIIRTLSSAFETCCALNHLDVAKYLCSRTSHPIHLRSAAGKVPLNLACNYGSLEVVQWLIEELKVDPNVCDEDGVTPFFSACCTGRMSVVRYLFGLKVNMEAKTVHAELRPIHAACGQGGLEVLKFLVTEAKVDTKACITQGGNVLHVAAATFLPGVVQWLLSNTNADVLGQMGHGKETPLAVAVRSTNTEPEVLATAQLLAVYSLTALDATRKYSDDRVFRRLFGAEVVRTALTAPLIVDINSLQTPIQLAIKYGVNAPAHFLMSMGIASSFDVRSGETPACMIEQKLQTATNETDVLWLKRMAQCCMPWTPTRSLKCYGSRFNRILCTLMCIEQRNALPMEMWCTIFEFLRATDFPEYIIATYPHEQYRILYKPALKMYKERHQEWVV